VPLLPAGSGPGAAGPHGTKPAPAAAAPAPAPAGGIAQLGAVTKIFFDTGKSDVPDNAKAGLAQLADAAKAKAGSKLVISGFHDASGDPAKNAELAKQRAMSVRDALKTAGVAEERIELKKPEQVNAGDAAQARRVEVTLQ
jgi:K(+)-stimulated pyrophosphate-energized sodium pump